MFESTTLLPDTLTDPGRLQLAVLNELEQRLNGTVDIADPNNGFNFQLEASTSMVAQSVQYMESVFNSIYPARATSATDLYRHMSDYDYVNLMAKPAMTTVRLILDRDYLYANAKAFSADYQKVVIPTTAVFTIGVHQFSLYYPIEIRINSRTAAFTVLYDTDVVNPLFSLSSNLLTYVTYTASGLNLLSIDIPVYQFMRTVRTETVVPEQGFRKLYSYTNKFYAARVYTKLNGAWQELAYTLSDDVYDRSVATVKLVIDDASGTCLVTVPQVYFTNNLVGNQLRIELLTTEGQINIQLTEQEVRSCNFDPDLDADTTTEYTSVLSLMPTAILFPVETTVVGGSSGLSYSELRRRIVSRSLYSKVPITDLELQNYLADNGFNLVKIKDNITDRIYYASRTLTNGDRVIPTTVANVVLQQSTLPEAKSILQFDDDIILALPTTLYHYTSGTNACTPLSDTEVQRLAKMTKSDLVTELNAVPYTRTPFHIAVYAHDKYPVAKTFDLLNLDAPTITFVRENAYSSGQMTVVSSTIVHRGNGTNGYEIKLGITKTSAIAALDESAIAVILTTVDESGELVHLRATKTGSTDTITVYTAEVLTDYHISQDRYIRTSMTLTSGSGVASNLPLSTSFQVKLLVSDTAFPDVLNDRLITTDLPTAYASWIGISHQQLNVSFGEDLSDVLYNKCNATWSQEVYAVYPENVYQTYEHDVYAYTSEGILDYHIDPVSGNLVITKLHSAGDMVLDAQNRPVIQHTQGEYKRDVDGNLMVVSQRELVYYVDAFMFDAKIYTSEDATDTAYLSQATKEISGYLDTIRSISGNLIERTNLYFRPVRTIGQTTFGLGGGNYAKYDLGLTFHIKYYVPKAVMTNDGLKSLMTSTTTSIIANAVSNQVISMTEMAKSLKQTFGDYITSVDVLGINGDPSLQTLIASEDGVLPTVSLRLVMNNDGSISLVKDIKVEYIQDN